MKTATSITSNLHVDHEEFEAFCKRWDVVEMALFGSALREDFSRTSDVDLLVSFHPNARRTLLDLGRMEEELEKMLGRSVDLVSRRGLESSRNYIRRRNILNSCEILYAA